MKTNNKQAQPSHWL